MKVNHLKMSVYNAFTLKNLYFSCRSVMHRLWKYCANLWWVIDLLGTGFAVFSRIISLYGIALWGFSNLFLFTHAFSDPKKLYQRELVGRWAYLNQSSRHIVVQLSLCINGVLIDFFFFREKLCMPLTLVYYYWDDYWESFYRKGYVSPQIYTWPIDIKLGSTWNLINTLILMTKLNVYSHS